MYEIKKKFEIQLIRLENGLFWPFYEKNKAWSASRLTRFLKEIEYQNIPQYILKIAAERGKKFHNAIQDYFEKGICPEFIEPEKNSIQEKRKINKIQKRVQETISFLKENKLLKLSKYISSEELHYTFHEEELIASYCDINFEDYIIELKTSNIKCKNNPVLLLIFEVQLLIQHLCSNKDVFLLWSTGEGVMFYKFKKTEKILKILNLLIMIAREEENYTEKQKKEALEKILESYEPIDLFFY